MDALCNYKITNNEVVFILENKSDFLVKRVELFNIDNTPSDEIVSMTDGMTYARFMKHIKNVSCINGFNIKFSNPDSANYFISFNRYGLFKVIDRSYLDVRNYFTVDTKPDEHGNLNVKIPQYQFGIDGDTGMEFTLLPQSKCVLHMNLKYIVNKESKE